MSFSENSRIRVVSDGQLHNSHVYYIDDNGNAHEMLATRVEFVLDAKDGVGKLRVDVPFSRLDVDMPVEVAELIRPAPEYDTPAVSLWRRWRARRG